MIAAPRGWVACYKHDNPPHHTYRPIIAWDESRCPLVVDDDSGLLVRADRPRNYDGAMRDPHAPVVALMPAGGWRIRVTSKHSGETWTEPLAGWGLREDGDVVPLQTDSLGAVESVDLLGDEYQIYHPDSATETSAGPTGAGKGRRDE